MTAVGLETVGRYRAWTGRGIIGGERDDVVNHQKMLRLAAVLGPGVIAGLFETIRHEYLEHWLPHALGNVATGILVVGASALLLVHIFRRLERWELEARRAKARHAALQERERIAADLHDYVSQSLFYMNVVLGSVEREHVAR